MVLTSLTLFSAAMLVVSVTRLEYFWKIFVTNFCAKVGKKVNYLLGYFEKHDIESTVAIFGQLVKNILAIIYFVIWSHWMLNVFFAIVSFLLFQAYN